MLLLAFQVKTDNFFVKNFGVSRSSFGFLRPRPIYFIQRNLNFQPFSDQNSLQFMPNTELLN